MLESMRRTLQNWLWFLVRTGTKSFCSYYRFAAILTGDYKAHRAL
jgi:hypothetical protein